MATSIEQILGKDINSLKELREEIKRLQDSIANVDPASQEFADTTEKLIAAQEQLTAVTRAGKDANVAATDSIVGMEREYKALYNTYKMLTEEQRNSPMGKEMAESLNNLSTKLNETKKNVGNFKDNIGRYSDSVIDAFGKMGIGLGSLQGPLKMAAGGFKTLGASLKALIANPVGVVIMAIVVAFKALQAIVNKVKDAINSNEESQMALKEAMSAFQPVIDAVSNAFDALGKVVVKVIGWMGEAFRSIREFFAFDKEAKQRIKEQNEAYRELARAQNELTKRKREYNILNAKDTAEVERLREEAMETDNKKEKLELLNQAKAKQEEIDARNIELAEENLRILQEEAKRTANDAATNEALAQAIADVDNARAQASRNARQLEKQIKSVTKSVSSGGKSIKQEMQELHDKLVEDYKDEALKLTEKYNKQLAQMKKYHIDSTLLTKKYNEDMAKLTKDAADKERAAYIERLNAGKEYADWRRELYRGNKSDEELELNSLEENLAIMQRLRTKFNQEFNEKFGEDIFDKDETSEEFKEFIQWIDNWVEEFNTQTGQDLKFPPDMNEEPFKSRWNQFNADFRTIWTQTVDKANDLEEKIPLINWSKMAKSADSQEIEVFRQQLINAYRQVLNESGVESEEYISRVRSGEWELLNWEKTLLEHRLANFSGTTEYKIEIEQRLYEIEEELALRQYELEQALSEKRIENTKLWISQFKSVHDVMSSIGDMYESIIDYEQNSGKITEQEAKKKKKALEALEKVMLAVNLMSIAGSTAAGIMDVWRGYAAEQVANAETAAATGPAAAATLAALNAKSLTAAVLKTAGLAAQGTAQMAAAIGGTISKLSSFNDGSDAATPTAVAPTEIPSEPYTYSRTLQTTEEEELNNRPIWVSVQDINSAQNSVKVVDEESTF